MVPMLCGTEGHTLYKAALPSVSLPTAATAFVLVPSPPFSKEKDS